MKTLVLIYITFSLLISLSLCTENCFENCNNLYSDCIIQPQNFLDFQHKKLCLGGKATCYQQCRIEESVYNVKLVENNKPLIGSGIDTNLIFCQGQCKRDMFKCQIGCKSMGAQCNFECDQSYRNCLTVTCQQ
ncbi:hypothetical protein TTHERM_00259470 (macronuclear) [Tetrahymena thermophila SB210]|uniref:Transmembrane protein n=1 Tax=Tetrahymena thermophila (strain SB210) TaxID=312017 RepID=Q22UD7_TETTS|nr:hypothetical protein TTHERM_00259470 [Tetrahymena thermophila SB210]EAR88750.1 hypothetical protein TTHERM_00259470 [Tetrahymena thermophila SB210]|eukprot:XP_001008995.1 hypothetical protein TTHERM_00259470 [Tetrahymena thermophila SB210]